MCWSQVKRLRAVEEISTRWFNPAPELEKTTPIVNNYVVNFIIEIFTKILRNGFQSVLCKGLNGRYAVSNTCFQYFA